MTSTNDVERAMEYIKANHPEMVNSLFYLDGWEVYDLYIKLIEGED